MIRHKTALSNALFVTVDTDFEARALQRTCDDFHRQKTFVLRILFFIFIL